MYKSCNYLRLLLLLILLIPFSTLTAQKKGLKTITEQELRYHVEFLGAKEFRGRETPSPELEIASLYLANCFKNIGLKPLMKDGSFYQNVPMTVTAVQPQTKMRIFKEGTELVFYFGKAFTGNFTASGSFGGDVVFAGAGITDTLKGWDDLKNQDLNGKVVVILDELRPEEKHLSGTTLHSRLNTRISAIRNRGASAVLTVISNEREEMIAAGNQVFDYIPTGRIGLQYDSQKTDFTSAGSSGNKSERPELPFVQAQISQELASQILELPKSEIGEMFRKIREGIQVPSAGLKDIRIQIDAVVDTYESTSRNVIAMVEGSDPVLRNEYIVVSGHHDGRGIDDGEIIPGADDNATAIVALLEIGQALLAEKPKRTVIMAAFTGEEQGMNGSHYFINNCPVPVEKISTCLNMDMIGRNHSDSLFLVGSDLLSSELDASIKRVNKKSGINFALDYKYSSISHPQNVYFRSDHYPFIRFGIPSVWIFSGFTPDYHTPRDLPEFINYTKFLKITKLVYVTAFDTGNLPALLKLDVNKAVTARGRQNNTETSLFRADGK
jgi:hypothetical protein